MPMSWRRRWNVLILLFFLSTLIPVLLAFAFLAFAFLAFAFLLFTFLAFLVFAFLVFLSLPG
jgi:hypothetical protein